MNSTSGDATARLLDRLRAGDETARDDLIRAAQDRLTLLARKMLRGQYGRLGRWVDTGDVFQNAALRLWTALGRVAPDSPLHFHRLAAKHVRLELLDLCRHHYGPQGHGANHESVAGAADGGTPPALERGKDQPDPARQAEWAELHDRLRGLPEDEAAVADLLFYQGLSQDEAAGLLGVDVRTVQRRWQRVRRSVGAMLVGDADPPGVQ